MDPYLEDRGLFPDFHNALASSIRGYLNRHLPPPYYATLESRQELDLEISRRTEFRRPDISVARHPAVESEGSVAVAVLPDVRTEVSPSYEMELQQWPTTPYFVEIRDPRSGHELVTLIEILSPSNKVAGESRAAYLQKRQAILQSKASLVELDLLRCGRRAIEEQVFDQWVEQGLPRTPYVVTVNRSWNRQHRPLAAYQIFPVALTDPLPVIPIPLREGEPEPTLDLQYLFRETYDSGPFARGAVDYRQPPPPPAFTPEELSWVMSRTETSHPAKPSGETT
jgi:hypothetical protein